MLGNTKIQSTQNKTKTTKSEKPFHELELILFVSQILFST